MQHIETISVQILLAGYEPPSSQFLCTLMFSLQQPEMLGLLVKEIRGAFGRYEDITCDALAELKVLNASLMESLRLTVIAGRKKFLFFSPILTCSLSSHLGTNFS